MNRHQVTQFLLLGSSLLLVIAVGVFAGMMGYRFFVHQEQPPVQMQQTNAAIISGSIQYNGIRPVSGSESSGRVVLYKRALSEPDFVQLPVSVPLSSMATWSWDGAESGETYELQAGVEFLGREIARSNTIIVTAPASGEQLTFNVSEDQIPDDVIALERELLDGNLTNESLPTPRLIVLQPPASESATVANLQDRQPVSVSGRVNLSGYIPPTARLSLKASIEGENNFQVVTTDIEPKDSAVWIWGDAEPGRRYQLFLELLDSDVVLGRSDPVVVAAPASNQYIQLVSSAQPPAQPQYERAAITGKIDLNGPVANNSSILILQRSPGESQYAVVARIPAGDGQTWSFDKAAAGAQYEMTAALQVNQENTSSANAVTLTAPASNVIFRINTNVSLDAPGQPRLLTCGTRKADGKWPAEVVFDHAQNANSYWFQVGSAAGKNDVYNERRNRSKTNEEKIIVDFENTKNYFVRYAQAQCADCRSDQDYSGFSESIQMSCGN